MTDWGGKLETETWQEKNDCRRIAGAWYVAIKKVSSYGEAKGECARDLVHEGRQKASLTFGERAGAANSTILKKSS